MTATQVPDTDEEQTAAQALDAACAKLPGVDRAKVASALDAVYEVYAQADRDDLDRVMEQTGFGGMEIENGVKVRLRYATTIASGMISAFDAMLDERGAENYVAWDGTVTDPARQLAIEAGLPPEQWPDHRRYHMYIVRPHGKTPQQLHREAQDRIDATLALARSGLAVLDPREVAIALGYPPDCSCDGGPEDWEGDYDPHCPRHGTREVTDEELLQLLPAAREATHWAMGARPDLYGNRAQYPHDPMLINVLTSVLFHVSDPFREETRRRRQGLT